MSQPAAKSSSRGRIVAIGESERKAIEADPRSADDLRQEMMEAAAIPGPTPGSFVFLWTFTPTHAGIILDHCNIGNRLIVRRHVESLKAEALAGKWYPNVDPMVITTDLHLIGGQHRLTMVRETGIPQTFLVVMGVPDEVKFGLDRGKPWSVADKLEADKIAVAGVKIICSIMSGKTSEPRDSEVTELYDRFGQEAAMVASIVRARRALIGSPCVAAFTLASTRVQSKETVLDLLRSMSGYQSDTTASSNILRIIERGQNQRRLPLRIEVVLRILDELAYMVSGIAPPEREKPTIYGLNFFMHEAKWRVV